jgi:hypothetical protein
MKWIQPIGKHGAAQAYDAAARLKFGSFARTNFPVGPPADGVAPKTE